MSWISPGRTGRFAQVIYEITEPILRVCRNIIPRTGMIDLSPLIAFFGIELVQYGIMKLFTQV